MLVNNAYVKSWGAVDLFLQILTTNLNINRKLQSKGYITTSAVVGHGELHGSGIFVSAFPWLF